MMTIRTPRILIVTPAKNESENLPGLATSLSSTNGEFIHSWVIVVNGSTDGSEQVARALKAPFPIHVLVMESSGDLMNAPEFGAFLYGANLYFGSIPECTHIMKLDADVLLEPNYFQILHESSNLAGISGGPLASEQNDTVPGAVKMYSRLAFEVIKNFPISLGFDVLDEIAVTRIGLPVSVNVKARFKVVRYTASSQGILKGRFRSGRICRWTGYFPPYFALRVIRYAFRKPLLLGTICMLAGYLSSQSGPWDIELKNEMRKFQKNKIHKFIRNPLNMIRIYEA